MFRVGWYRLGPGVGHLGIWEIDPMTAVFKTPEKTGRSIRQDKIIIPIFHEKKSLPKVLFPVVLHEFVKYKCRI
jgi:hypothetical protein